MQVVYALGNIELYSFAVNGHVGDAADGVRVISASGHAEEVQSFLYIFLHTLPHVITLAQIIGCDGCIPKLNSAAETGDSFGEVALCADAPVVTVS